MSVPLFLSPQTFRPATSTAAGLNGLVPSPAAGQQGYFLRADATWVSAENVALPPQAGATGKILSSDGVNAFWATSIGALTSSEFTGPIGGATRHAGAFSTLSVTSTDNVANLNASSLNGATFASPGPIGGTLADIASFSQLTTGATTRTPVVYATGANIQIRFDLGSYGQIDLTTNAAFTGSAGMVRGRTQVIDLTNPSGGAFTLSWPGAWKLLNGALPTSIAAGQSIRVELNCGGTTEASIIAGYSLSGFVAGVLAPANGGTGVNNGSSTLTLAGNVTHAGLFSQSFTATANTSLTLPVTGTLATLSGTENLSNKTITASSFSGTTVRALNNLGGYQAVIGQATGGDRVGISGQASGGGTGFVFFDVTESVFRPSTFDASLHSFKIGGVATTSITSTGFQGAIGATTPAAANFTSIGLTTQGTGAFTTLGASGLLTVASNVLIGSAFPAGDITTVQLFQGSNVARNWRLAANVAGGEFTITPSTAGGGTTYTTSVVTVTTAGVAITGTLSASGLATFRDAGNTYSLTASGGGGTQFVALGNSGGVPRVQAWTAGFGAATQLDLNPAGGLTTVGAGLAVTGALSATDRIKIGGTINGTNGLQFDVSNSLAGVEFFASPSGLGYGHRIIDDDSGAGFARWKLQGRTNSASWTTVLQVDGTTGLAVTGTLSASNQIFTTGANTAHGASRALLDQESSAVSVLTGYGPDASTNGSLLIRSRRSDGSNAVTHTFSSTGLAVTGALSATGISSVAGGQYFSAGSSGTGAPTFTTRSAGTKIILYDQISGSSLPFSLGIDSGTLWLAAGGTSDTIKSYVGTSLITTVSSTGLQVTGALSATGQFTGQTNFSIGGSGFDYPSSGYNFTRTATSGVYNYTTTDPSSRLEFTTGGFKFFTAPSGTAGNAITFTERANITSTGLAVTGALSATGEVSSASFASNRFAVNSTPLNTTSTAHSFARFQTTGADFYVGTESSTGGGFFPGSTAYAAVLYNATATPLHFYTGGTIRATVSSTGLAVTGALSCTGALAIGNTVNTVSPTSPNRTITMVIGGTTYYLAAKTTND